MNSLEPWDQSDRQKQTKVEDKIFWKGSFWAQSEIVKKWWKVIAVCSKLNWHVQMMVAERGISIRSRVAGLIWTVNRWVVSYRYFEVPYFVNRLVMNNSEISIPDLIWFFLKISISNYERFLPPVKDLSDACAQWLVRLAWPLLFQYFRDSYACEPTIQYGHLAKI